MSQELQPAATNERFVPNARAVEVPVKMVVDGPTQVEEAIDRARTRIAPLWPLENFVAVNPFLSLSGEPFAEDAFEAVVDLVAGPRWPDMIAALRRGGRYVTAGAIAGPIVELDVRTLYLRDLTLFGSTFQPENIMPDVIGYIEQGELRPLIAQTFALKDLRRAQEAFLKKDHLGKIVIRID